MFKISFQSFSVTGMTALWFLVVPAVIGAVFHLWAIIDAARYRSGG
ncbi:hypothetical protein LOC50_00005 [Pseudoalteromonas sp. SCSIO 43095]|nr:hypothetical protein [Pseudoalteromonas sp. SCSIO 43095]URR00142.1 hypothetical protein LOC50_00005 [Pseudoalteromonas sp. SCSIO 43095]